LEYLNFPEYFQREKGFAVEAVEGEELG